jgi:Ca-activated chloride channel family protein
MAIDVSASMLAKDLKPNRLEALKNVAIDFVDRRPNDRIGIVVYAGESFTQTPITSDKSIVKRTIDGIQWGQLEDGTAIGMGLGSGVNRLKESKAKSKVIILLTDGVNNSGNLDPKTATELAKELNIKVYTIGIGTNGMAESPYSRDPRTGRFLYRNMKVEIDEALLKDIANQTEGKYFRATNNTSLKEIYDEIDKLEKTKIEEFKYYNYQEKFRIFVFMAIGFLLLEFILRNTIFKSFI